MGSSSASRQLVLCDAREVVCSLGVLAARVVQHAQLVEYGGLVRRDGVRLFDVVHRERQVVGAQVLHPDAYHTSHGTEPALGSVL